MCVVSQGELGVSSCKLVDGSDSERLLCLLPGSASWQSTVLSRQRTAQSLPRLLEEADLPQRVQTEQLEQDDVRRSPRKVPSVQRGAVCVRRGPALPRCWRKRPGYAVVPVPQQAGGLREVAV